MKLLLLSVAVVGLVIGPSIIGIYLTFKASIILGIIFLVAEPGPAIIGWIAIFGHADVAKKLAHWLNLPF